MFGISKKINSVIIVDIGSKLKLLKVELKRKARINALKVIELPEENRDELILSSLRGFIKENHIRHKNVILKPCLSELLIKRIQLPSMPESELPEAVKWQIKEDINFDLSKAIIDFSIVKRTTGDDGSKTLDVMCAVAQEEEIRSQVLLLKKLGLNCLSVGLLPFGYASLFKEYQRNVEGKCMGALHLEDDVCYIAVYKNNKLEFCRDLPLSINTLKESLKDMLVSEKGKIELSDNESQEVLFEAGIPFEGDSTYKNKLSSVQILSMLRPILERLIVEIKRSISYYNSQFQGDEVDRILVVGKASKIPNLDRYLSKELSLDVEKVPILDQLKNSNVEDFDALLESYADLGLAFNYRESINLLPYEFRSESIERFERLSLRWIVFIAVLLLSVSYFFSWVGVESYQKRLNNAKLHLEVLNEVKQKKSTVDTLINFLTQMRTSEPPVAALLNNLSNITTEELFLDRFLLKRESKSGEMSGTVKSSKENPDVILTNLIRDMESSSYFTDANISSLKKSTQENVEILSFT